MGILKIKFVIVDSIYSTGKQLRHRSRRQWGIEDETKRLMIPKIIINYLSHITYQSKDEASEVITHALSILLGYL